MAMHQHLTLISPWPVELHKRLHLLVHFELYNPAATFQRLAFEMVVIEVGLIVVFGASQLTTISKASR